MSIDALGNLPQINNLQMRQLIITSLADRYVITGQLNLKMLIAEDKA